MPKFEEVDDFEEQNKELEARKASRVVGEEASKRAIAQIRRDTPDLVKRARDFFSRGLIDFPDVKKVRVGDSFVTQAQMTDQNKVVIMDAMFGNDEAAPHRDHFVGRIVDQEGRIIDEKYPVTRWIEAFAAGGLKGVQLKAAREVVKEWALNHERNSLITRLDRLIPEWDRVPRMRRKLIELFDPADTTLNEDFGEYFWLSLYARMMMPGTIAPMVLCLFGRQGCGKSLFGKRVAQIIMGNEESDSVMLDLGAKTIDFLRDITGHSVVAAVGEMTGFNRGDLNKIKDFITRTSDPMHHKFEGHFIQPRQWITIMDGNKYEVQRDETGNRRFYPMFCGQVPDEGGQRRWSEKFSAVEEIISADFDKDVWQLLAEAADWFERNGTAEYGRLVGDVGEKVLAFSKNEMAAERGTVDDEAVGPYIDSALRKVDKLIITRKDKSTVMGIKREDLFVAMDEIAGYKVSASRGFGIGLNKAMKARGGGDKTFLAIKIGSKVTTTPGYRFTGCKNVEEFIKSLDARMGVTNDEDYDESKVEPGF